MKRAFLIFLFLADTVFALENKGAKQYPNISGRILFEVKTDHLSSKDTKVPANNTYINIEPDFSLNIDKNWSVKTGWRIYPVKKRDEIYPERTRTFFSENRGFKQDDTGVIIEELKVNFQTDDVKFFAGKFNPTFATAYRKEKRIGVFNTDFTEDYELREKIGGGMSAILDNSELSFSGFFNDDTDLSRSAFKDRGKASRNDGLAGNTGTLSSYTITLEGADLLDVQDLFYNFGYRNLDIDDSHEGNREKGYTVNLEYPIKTSENGAITPFFELVKINNFTGRSGRDAIYLTTALLGRYNKMTASVSNVMRDIKKNPTTRSRDNQFQVSIGYKITDSLTIDLSRAVIREVGNRGVALGAMMSYIYQF
jgi:hypothetical protein